jgi:hypothetical protein
MGTTTVGKLFHGLQIIIRVLYCNSITERSLVSSVGIVTGCGLDSRGSIQAGREIFLFSGESRRALNPLSLLYNGYRMIVPRGKEAGT